jgi:hypothetical protein
MYNNYNVCNVTLLSTTACKFKQLRFHITKITIWIEKPDLNYPDNSNPLKTPNFTVIFFISS